MINLIFYFLAIFFILSVCWFTPLAGTPAAYENTTKRFAIIGVLSVIFTGAVGALM
ncbi:MAG: hypothetical protein VX278_00935 [Myxococcota bacterium]|nr:hypothetical protein [Myxococcota bacterium]